MHPGMPLGMIGWWKHGQQRGSCGGGEARAECGPPWQRGGEWSRDPRDHDGAHAGPEHDGSFGVRRPLRFLSYKLELDEPQVAELARVLNELKTERAQVAVDERRTTAAIADAMAGDSLDEAKLGEATAQRVKSAERLRDAVGTAIKRIHAILTPEQRSKFAYLIRTGALSI